MPRVAPAPATAPAPAQTVGRAVELLRLVASSRSRQLRLIDLADQAGLDKSTTHRLLQRLLHERLLARGPGQRGYRLGPLLHELGLAAQPGSNLQDRAEPALRQLAHATGDMVFLVARSGFESVCLDRVDGHFAIRTLTAGVGDRHPLGVGAGGLALLAALDEAERAAVLRAVAPQLGRYGLDARRLRERVAQTRRRGAALDEGVAVAEVTALGRALRDGAGQPAGAVFVASIQARMTPRRLVELDRRLLACVREVEAALAAGGAPGTR